jgi:2,3-bisphosphoglycerate-independent phosphoglycerate mutase
MKKQAFRPTMLMILDGWGASDADYGNAVKAARTPNLDRLLAEHPNTLLKCSGLAVGLPEGQMGNSEVGHLNIGAGRTVYQALTRISKAISDGDFFTNPVLISAMENAKGHALHIMGLVGPGGVHSHQAHLVALVRMAKAQGVENIYIHAFLDGRDTPPRSASAFLAELERDLSEVGAGQIATISGRYYAMDRDKRWERVQKVYDALTLGNGLSAASVTDAINAAYERGENDEFVLPTNIRINGRGLENATADGLANDSVDGAEKGFSNSAVGDSENEVLATVKDGDSVIFFNFRPDRARELTRCFVDPDFDGFLRSAAPSIPVFATMTEYDRTMPNVAVAFPPEDISNTLGEYLSHQGLSQLRIAETEKYAHVTFFFNGGVEEPNPGEERILIPSPKVATYDLQPEMSAFLVRDRVISEIVSGHFDVIVLNFANMDMVGHTGIMEAAIKAVEAVDGCVGAIADAILKVGGQLLITADHGNSETMLTEDGKPITAHSSNPVHLILVRANDADDVSHTNGHDVAIGLSDGGALSDLAPTMLDMMGLPIPAEMTGHSLLKP